MQFSLTYSGDANETLERLEAENTKKSRKVLKALALMETNIQHQGLHTHKYDGYVGRNGEEVFEAYVENHTPGAYSRIYVFLTLQHQKRRGGVPLLKLPTSLTVFAVMLMAPRIAVAASSPAVEVPTWHFVKQPGQHVVVHVEALIKADAADSLDGVVVMGIPVASDWQSGVTAKLTFDDQPVGTAVAEASTLHRKVYISKFDRRPAVKIGADLSADLTTYKIESGAPSVPVPDLSPAETQNSLAPTANFDFTSPAFVAYVRSRNLLWARSAEDRTNFLFRAASQVKHDFTYYDGDQDRHVSALVCSLKGDCGAINGVLVSVMRYNGIPAQLWGGIRVAQQVSTLSQPHVVAAVFILKNGWLPVDLASGDQVVYAMAGNPLLVTQVDSGLVFTPTGWNELHADWVQPFAWFYRGGKLAAQPPQFLSTITVSPVVQQVAATPPATP